MQLHHEARIRVRAAPALAHEAHRRIGLEPRARDEPRTDDADAPARAHRTVHEHAR
ncbi:hypothetical protein EVG20_g8556, partial [Dentipellis fragilis]